MNKQINLVRLLRRELAAKEQELANQKWIFEQFQKSPSWRWSAPLRWILDPFIRSKNGNAPAVASPISDPTESPQEPETPEVDIGAELKTLFTGLGRVTLKNFLASHSTLDLPQVENPTVSIILVLGHRAEFTLTCLRSIGEIHSSGVEVVAVDNASSDETSQLLERIRGMRIFRNAGKVPWSLAVNQAARECRGEYILLLNNDAQLLSGALESALRTMESASGVGATGGKIILPDGTLQEAGSIVWQDGSCSAYGYGDDPLVPMYNFRRNVDFCSRAFLLTPRKIWEQIGGLDSAFEPAPYAEADYCIRIRERGLRVVYEPGAAVIQYDFDGGRETPDASLLQARSHSALAERHVAALATHRGPGMDELLCARSWSSERRILFIDDRVPHFWLGSGFPRAHAMIRTLIDNGYFVTFYPLAVIDEPWDVVYSDFPREIEVMMGMGRETLEACLRSRRDYYSSIVVSRPHNMARLASLLASHADWFENIEVIYDAEALFAAREAGRRELAGSPMSKQKASVAFASEIRLAASADRVIAVSDSEREAFHRGGIERVDVIGHSLELNPGATPFEAREGFLFVGAVYTDSSPNADSLIWFLDEIFPRIRKKLGDVPVTIVGVNQSDRIRRMAVPPVRVLGQLPELAEVYDRSRVFIAPTRFAAGIPHKVHEAAAHGLPVVATPLLADQLGWTESELAIGGNTESFAARCAELYTDATRWKGLREAAMDRVRRECSPQAFEQSVLRILPASPAVSS